MLQNCYYDDAYYLGGYAFELLLKARICKNLLIPDFFDFESSKKRRLPGNKNKGDKKNLYKPFKVHDYEQLIILCGLYTEFYFKVENDPVFESDWWVIMNWNEGVRYSKNRQQKEVASFISSIKNMVKWLQQHL